ncbi:MAG: DNA repair protein RadA, partial [Clostridia bacterium]|nr:DNA repair protein RadA [Clostridia bacterium]
GVHLNRVLLMLAILDRRLGFNLGSLDVYVNAAGGLRIEEPAIDLGICVALISSFRGIPVNTGTVLVGEVGLAGEVRRVPQLEKRILEARQLGFGRCLVPRGEALAIDGIEVVEVPSVGAAIELALGG